MSHKIWTISEIDTLLKGKLEGKTWDKIGEELGRSKKSCIEKYKAITSNSRDIRTAAPLWTHKEMEMLKYLKRNTDKTWDDIGLSVGKTGRSCRAKWERLIKSGEITDIDRAAPPKWTSDEEMLLVTLKQSGKTWAEIGSAVGKTVRSCRSKWERLVQEGKITPNKRATVPRWTKDEEMLLGTLKMSGKTWGYISQQLGIRTPYACKTHWEAIRNRSEFTKVNSVAWTDDDIICLIFLADTLKNTVAFRRGLPNLPQACVNQLKRIHTRVYNMDKKMKLMKFAQDFVLPPDFYDRFAETGATYLAGIGLL